MLSQGPTAPPGPETSTLSNTLTIGRVQQSDAGTYQCQVTIGGSTRTDSTMLQVTGQTYYLYYTTSLDIYIS